MSPPAAPFPPLPGSTTGRRQAARVRLEIPARLTLLGGQCKCWLQDLSQTGARLTGDDLSARRGESAVLEACGHEAFGTVVWTGRATLALQFEELLAMPAIVEIRNFSDGYRAYELAQTRRMAREFVQGRRQVL